MAHKPCTLCYDHHKILLGMQLVFTLVQSVRRLKIPVQSSKLYRAVTDVSLIAGRLWHCLEPSFAEDYHQGLGSQGLRFFLTLLSGKLPSVLPWCWGSFCILQKTDQACLSWHQGRASKTGVGRAVTSSWGAATWCPKDLSDLQQMNLIESTLMYSSNFSFSVSYLLLLSWRKVWLLCFSS